MSGPSLRVAVIDEDFPFPLTTGKRLRSYHLLTRLARRHTVYYFARPGHDPLETQRAVVELRGRNVVPILVDARVLAKRSLRFLAELAWNLVSPLPVPAQIHTPAPFRRALEQAAVTLPIDLWHCEWSPLAVAMTRLPPAPRIVMAHNVEALIWRRIAEHERNPIKARYFRMQRRKFERFERDLFRDHYVVTVSEEDSAVARRAFGYGASAVIENGVDAGYFSIPAGPSDPHRLLFLGSLDWRANLDAVEWFLDRVWPGVRQRHPDVRFSVVGRNPPRWLTERAAATPGVEVHANVADVKPFLASAGLMVVPLRIGGGSRLKIIEAAAAGLPVLTTAVGCEGLTFVPDEHLTVADTPEAMVRAVGASLAEQPRFRRMAAAAREFARRHYDWDHLAAKLERCWFEAYESWEPPAAARRQPLARVG